MKKIAKKTLAVTILFALFLGALPLPAQDKPLWLRYPAISPDGSSHPVLLPGRHLQGPRRGRAGRPPDHRRGL